MQTTGRHGTPAYMAPEQFMPGADVGRPADLWGWAASVVHMLAGVAPFASQPLHAIPRLVCDARQQPAVPMEAMRVPGLDQLLRDCFAWEAQQRPTAAEALARLDMVLKQVGRAGWGLLSHSMQSKCL
jgi:serine/threonine protein kinase